MCKWLLERMTVAQKQSFANFEIRARSSGCAVIVCVLPMKPSDNADGHVSGLAMIHLRSAVASRCKALACMWSRQVCICQKKTGAVRTCARNAHTGAILTRTPAEKVGILMSHHVGAICPHLAAAVVEDMQ